MNRSSRNTVGAYEAKTHFSEILEKVEAGEEITITRHGTPVARMVPVKKRFSESERRTAIEQIKQLSQGLSLRGLKIRELIEEGRR
jgi:prevent-host-death family protein